MDYHAFVPPSAWEFSVKPEENNSKSLILGIMDDVGTWHTYLVK